MTERTNPSVARLLGWLGKAGHRCLNGEAAPSAVCDVFWMGSAPADMTTAGAGAV